jgi:hypothetical protein
MAEIFSFAISLLSVITNIPYLGLIVPIEVQKDVIYIGLSFANLIVNTVNPFPLTEVHRFSSPLLTPDCFGLLAVLMWAILHNS